MNVLITIQEDDEQSSGRLLECCESKISIDGKEQKKYFVMVSTDKTTSAE